MVRSGKVLLVALGLLLVGVRVRCVPYASLVCYHGLVLFSFRRRRDDSPDRGHAKRKKGEGDAGRTSKVPCTERWSKDRVVPPTASELERMPFLVKRAENEKTV